MSLFSGIGGADLGVKLAVPSARTVCYVEREAFCCTHLVHKMEAGELDPAPVWTDVTTFDGKPWRGLVDLISAGFPCQPHSVAGKRAGTNDARWLWLEIERIISQVEPSFVLLENVPGLRTSGFEHVLWGLAALGFNAEWGVLRACDVGAPHARRRLFILAYRDGERQQGERSGRLLDGERSTCGHDADGPSCKDVADTNGVTDRSKMGGYLMVGGDADRPHTSGSERGRSIVVNTKGIRNKCGAVRSLPTLAQPYPPGPEGKWAEWDGPQPAIRRDADGLSNRLDRLRGLGNAVVPQQLAEALEGLCTRIP